MSKVLIVDQQYSVRKLLTGSLSRNGHEVAEAINGQAALEFVNRESFDLMLLDFDLPDMDGCQVLSTLKADPRTRSIPVIMLTDVQSNERKAACLRLGASNIVTKPCDGSLARYVRVALHEGQEIERVKLDMETTPPVAFYPEVPAAEAMPDTQLEQIPSDQPSKFISKGGGLVPLELVLCGGLCVGELAIIEGPPDSGKSLICQYLTYGAVKDGGKAALFTSSQTAEALSQQMGSIGMDVSQAIHDRELLIHPIAELQPGESPESIFGALACKIENLPRSCGLVVIDGITDLAIHCKVRTVMGFFSIFQDLCAEGKTIVVVVESSAFDSDLIGRLHQLCNTHISMKVKGRHAKVLKAAKVNNQEMRGDNGFSFRIEPGVGANVIPMFRVQI
jgi:archaellum biogenesis ATPase FlaH/CheY-like chemotaxis protein